MTVKTRSQRPKGRADVLPLASSLRLAVMRLARRLRQQGEADVTPSMLSALATIERHGPMKLAELAAHERVTPPTITTIVARLERAGMAAKDTDLDDRRISWISLTSEGKRFVEAARSKKTAYLARRLRTLSPEDRAVLERAAVLLERLVEEDA